MIEKFFIIYKSIISPLIHQLTGTTNQGCRFTPTCSEYSEQAIKKYGSLKGTYKAIHRIIRCGPWSKGGIDLP